jgi:two-component system LytT family sensor kinase
MIRRNFIYWICQLTGWGVFVAGNLVMASMQGSEMNLVYYRSIFMLLFGLGITHSYRLLVHARGWTSLEVKNMIPRMIFASLLLSVAFTFFNEIFKNLLLHEPLFSSSTFDTWYFLRIVNASVLFLLWNVIYFAVHSFENWKKEEIENLELRAAKSESELNSFRSQMNPHFMFNSLNSIKALVDEEPQKARHAIVMLSGILRTNMMHSKRQTIPLQEELDLVSKYLELEKIRFEDRLVLKMDIDPNSLVVEVPPFMLQTIVENAIKHGISKQIKGGAVEVKTEVNEGVLKITVANTGELKPEVESEGIGLLNTQKRLDLLYRGKATFSLKQFQEKVVCEVTLPIV